MDPITLFYNEQPVLIECIPSLRAKRLSLRFSPRKNGFVLTVPYRTREAIILDFLNRCQGWIEKNLARVSGGKEKDFPLNLTLCGQSFACLVDPLRRKPILCEETNLLHLPPECPEKDLHRFFKEKAKEWMEPWVVEMAYRLKKPLNKVTFRDTHSRWGSCSAHKTISLSWRLVLAPREVAYYVCAHEVAHLVHMNHSMAFWKVVEGLCPDYKAHKTWLRIHGASLLRKFNGSV